MPVIPVPPSSVTPTTAGDIIRSALRLINALASGEQPSGAEMTDALAAANVLDRQTTRRSRLLT